MKIGLILKARAGLVDKKVSVTRGGKTFQQTVYVRAGEKPKGRDIFTLNVKGKKISIEADTQLAAVRAAEKKYGVKYGEDLKIASVHIGEAKKKDIPSMHTVTWDMSELPDRKITKDFPSYYKKEGHEVVVRDWNMVSRRFKFQSGKFVRVK